jgi:DNA-binding NarL/FixJ family response regulator
MLLENFHEFKVIIEASNGKELMEKINHSKSLPQIALVDVSMPLMNGFETTRQLLAEYPNIKVVALSVHNDLRTVSEMIHSGANAYLLKDTSRSLVKYTLLQVYEKGFYYDHLVIDSLMKAKNKDEELNSFLRGKYSSGSIALLTDREIEFIKYCCSEMTYKQIAEEMNVSLRTIDGHRDSVFKKLEVKSRTGLVLFAIHAQIISVE